MLEFIHQGQLYQLPLLADTSHNCLLVEKEGLQLNLVFEVPPTAVSYLYTHTPLLQTDENPLLFLELEINTCDFDLEKEEWKAIGNLPYPIEPQALENLSLSAPILAASTLYLPGYAQACTLHQLQFGTLHAHQIAVSYQASAIDIYGNFEFKVEVEGIALQVAE